MFTASRSNTDTIVAATTAITSASAIAIATIVFTTEPGTPLYYAVISAVTATIFVIATKVVANIDLDTQEYYEAITLVEQSS